MTFLRNKSTLIPLILAVVLLPAGLQAADEDTVAAVKLIMARKPFFLKQPGNPFCGSFLRDFRTLKGMALAQPVARASSYDDPMLARYKARCGGQPLNEKFECDARTGLDTEWSKDWKVARQQFLDFCEVFYGTANFKLFELDIDNNPKNGKELIVHFERVYGPQNREREKYYSHGEYNVFDGGSCEYVGGASTHDPYDYFRKHPLDSYNGIISYQGRYFIFDLFDLEGSDRNPSDPEYYLKTNTIGPSRTDPDRSLECSYSTIPPTTKPAAKSRKQRGSK